MAFPKDSPAPDQVRGGPEKHEQARRLVEAALRAEAAGDAAEAERLFDQAQRTDPEAVANVLQERDAALSADFAGGAGEGAEVAAVTGTIEPHADAPPRAGIGGPGSSAGTAHR